MFHSFSGSATSHPQPADAPFDCALEALWAPWEKRANEVIRECTTEAFDDVERFVLRHRALDSELLPVAVVMGSLSAADASMVFDKLRDRLSGAAGMAVALVSPREGRRCTLNAALALIAEQVLASSKPKTRMRLVDSATPLQAVECWVDAHLGVEWTSAVAPPYPPNAAHERGHTIAVVFPDFDELAPDVANGLVLALAHLRQQRRISVVVVVGLKVCVETGVQSFLDTRAFMLIRVQNFRTKPAVDVLGALFERLLLSDNPSALRLGDKVLAWLADMFTQSSESVNAFMNALKFCVLEHLDASAVFPALCAAEVPQRVAAALSPNDLAAIRALPSVKGKSGLNNDKQLRVDVAKWLDGLNAHRRAYGAAFECVRIVFRAFGKTFVTNAAASGLQVVVRDAGNVLRGKSAHHRSAGGSTPLDRLSLEALRLALDACVPVLAKQAPATTEAASRLTALLGNPGWMQRSGLRERERVIKEVAVATPKPKDFDKWAEQAKRHWRLQHAVQTKEVVSTEGERELKQLVLAWIDYLCSTLLVNASSLPLGEAFFYNDTRPLACVRPGAFQRAALLAALLRPGKVLGCKCCAKGELGPNSEDMCVAFHVLASKTAISLGEWFEAFAQVVEPSHKRPKRSKENDDDVAAAAAAEVPSELNARFTRAVGMLEFLGFWRTTTRGTKVVKRQIWVDLDA